MNKIFALALALALAHWACFFACCNEAPVGPIWECPHSILLKEEKETKVFCSALQPLVLKLSRLEKVKRVRVVSAKFPKALNVEREVKNDSAEFALNYKDQAALEQPDTITLSTVLGEGTEETVLAKLSVYPVLVEMAETGPRMDSFSTHIDFMLDPAFDGKGAFQYRVRPWDPALAKHIYFASLPPYFCEATLSFSQPQTDKATGEVKIRGEAKAPGMTAVTAMLGQDLWLECCPKRFSVYLDFQHKAPLKTAPPSKAEVEAVDKALDEIYPEPRDELTKKGIRQLREVFHAHHVPYLPEGLKSLSTYTRGTAVKNAGEPWEDLIMAAGEHSIRFAPPPPKPAHAINP